MNKPNLPAKDFIKSMKIPKMDSVALHNHGKEMSLVVKKVKSSKHVGVLTSIHNKFTMVEGGKTEAHMFYNACKGGTDAFDARCAISSVSRKTRHWPLCVFYQLINIAMNNAFILYDQRPHPRIQESYTSKGDFLTEVAYRMCRPWAVEKYRRLGNRHPQSRIILHSTFQLTDAERGDLLQPPPP